LTHGLSTIERSDVMKSMLLLDHNNSLLPGAAFARTIAAVAFSGTGRHSLA
jgi:hypothetical protein